MDLLRIICWQSFLLRNCVSIVTIFSTFFRWQTHGRDAEQGPEFHRCRCWCLAFLQQSQEKLENMMSNTSIACFKKGEPASCSQLVLAKRQHSLQKGISQWLLSWRVELCVRFPLCNCYCVNSIQAVGVFLSVSMKLHLFQVEMIVRYR